MKKMAAWMTAVVLLSATWSGTTTYGSNVNDLKNQQNNIKNTTQGAQQQLKEAQEKKSAALEEVEEADAELSVAADELMFIMEELDKTTELLEKTEKELAAAQKDREAQYEVMKKRLRFMYENGKTSYLHVLFNTNGFGDFINRVEYINRIVSYDNNMVENLQAVEDIIAVKVDETERQKAEVEVLARQQTQKKERLEAVLADKTRVFETMKANEDKLTQQINDLNAADKKIEALIKAEQARQAAARASSASNVSTSANPYNGKIAWPVPGRYNRSSGYGNRTSPISGRREFHTGIDIPAATGTNIVSSDKGTVVAAGNIIRGYGNSILVDHGNGLSTFYAHASKLVAQTGQTVSKGETIAKVGSTGYSTGPHLHFEVRVNGSHTNPLPYVQ